MLSLLTQQAGGGKHPNKHLQMETRDGVVCDSPQVMLLIQDIEATRQCASMWNTQDQNEMIELDTHALSFHDVFCMMLDMSRDVW